MKLILIMFRILPAILLRLGIILATNTITVPVAGTITGNTELDPISQQIKWLRERGGFFSHKISHDINTGAFSANTYIQEGEELMRIPASILINGGPDEDKCITAETLWDEYNLGEESEFAPYARYVFESFDHYQNPLTWSDAAVDLFMNIIGKDLEPKDFREFLFNNNFNNVCDYDSDHSVTVADKEGLAAAYRIVVMRGWEDVLVPIFDLMNHRNGKYHNIDQENSAHDDEDISIIAIQDIPKGEMLHYSYNECNDLDCYEISETYVTPDIFANYGFVEQYPRRFNFHTFYEEEHVIFEIDMDDDGNVELDWISEPIDVYELNWFRGNLNRLYDMETTILQQVDKLARDDEKTLILQYYQATVIALEAVISWEPPSDIDDFECSFDEESNQQDQTCKSHVNEEEVYSDLLDPDDTADPLNYQTIICGDGLIESKFKNHRVVSSHSTRSQYQPIAFTNLIDNVTGQNDTCLYLHQWVQTCISFRPHYHEWLIHYPASYLKQVKNVLFLGGGDNMALHEILKYPTLELVMGLELDQQVVRNTFKYMKIQPHFDVHTVQWWFGDASKSLQIIAEHYYGTFDMVVVDLHTYVTELMVTIEHNFIDFAMLLLKPDGIFIQNEDYTRRTNTDFARYIVDLELNDIPILCHQSITMASNHVDFLKAKRFDHDVDAIIYDTNDANAFQPWWNYHHVAHPRTKRINMGKNNQNSEYISTMGNKGGVILVLEIEEVSHEVSSTRSMSDIHDLIVRVLMETKLTFLSSSSYESESIFILLREGYVTLRSFLDDFQGYYACDLYFWSSFDKQESAKSALVTILGGLSSSSFRIVTTGMMPNSPKSLQIPIINDDSDPHHHAGLNRTETDLIETLSFPTILNKMPTSMMQSSTEPTFAVFCANTLASCKSLDILRQFEGETVIKLVPVKSCSTEDSLLRDLRCEEEVTSTLSAHGKIDGIIIDPMVNLKMGQVLLEVFKRHKNREKILNSRYMILAPYSLSSGSWRKALIEHFRIALVKFNPTFHADISITDKETESTSSLNIFSAGDDGFYANLFDLIDNIISTGNTLVTINSVKGGMLNYIPELKPNRVATDSDYDGKTAQRQFNGQRPLGHQSVMQFEFERPHSPLYPGDKVLARSEQTDEYLGEWYMGKVLRKVDENIYKILLDTGEKKSMYRHLIRKWEEEREVSVSDQVLVYSNAVEEDLWYQGTVLDRISDSKYKVHIHNDKAQIIERNKEHLIRKHEELLDVNDDSRSLLSTNLLKVTMLKAIVRTISDQQQIGNVESKVYDNVEEGSIICLYWRNGSAILTWDGGRKFALNLVTYENSYVEDLDVNHDLFRDKFLQSLHLPITLSSHDHHPRGFGRVVNFKSDLS